MAGRGQQGGAAGTRHEVTRGERAEEEDEAAQAADTTSRAPDGLSHQTTTDRIRGCQELRVELPLQGREWRERRRSRRGSNNSSRRSDNRTRQELYSRQVAGSNNSKRSSNSGSNSKACHRRHRVNNKAERGEE
jgi:hypothetical protein